eukprot:CAMPEP_0198295814 /NCGR_PEP_ID=MMETSP1449-20131203/29707_1 /TAXON_ID=420275 /ORGANISM="Attheya septentrionalis, Strain CCMP2084" /LENGTH=41 /DNA_ID= /DNA_START= /DNA_END= /DNA_ORIENTATION=
MTSSASLSVLGVADKRGGVIIVAGADARLGAIRCGGGGEAL